MNSKKKPPQRKAPWYIQKHGTARPPKVRRRINPVSVQRRAAALEYGRLRKKFLAEHPLCRACITLLSAKVLPATEIHHCRGRRGSNYLNTMTWIGVCAGHHREIHDHPAWALEHGFLGSFHA